jgi:hypothetical protein
MPENRGFHFLAGLATLWLLWRLYVAGVIFQAVAYATGNSDLVSSGPGAIIVAFIIEGIITIGWVVTLLLSGIWDAIIVVGRLIADAFGAGHGYLKDAQVKPEETPTVAKVLIPEASGKTPEQLAIETLSLQLVEISKRLPPVEAEVAE